MVSNVAMAKASHQAVLMQSQRDWRGVMRTMRLVLLLVAIAGAGVWLVQKMNNPNFLPINKVKAQGSFKHVTETMLQTVLGQIKGGYFSINVAQVQRDVESLPWVDTASVRRVWPDVLMVNTVEQEPVAYWKSDGLVNVRGEIFMPAMSNFKENLPVLNGPERTNIILMTHFKTVSELLNAIDLQVVRIDMDARRALVLWLDNGIKLVLGRDATTQRLQRFIRVYPKILAVEAEHIARVDMRYTNGFAITRKL